MSPSGWQGSTRRARLPSNWPQTRVFVLERDGYICYVCGQPGADEVDHVDRGDDHRPTNLKAIHDNPCHRRKSAREGAAVSNRRFTDRKRPAEPHPGAV